MEINITQSGKATTNWCSTEANQEQVKQALRVANEYKSKIKNIKFKRVKVADRLEIEVREDISDEDLKIKISSIKNKLKIE